VTVTVEEPRSVAGRRWPALLLPLTLAALLSGLLVYALHAAAVGPLGNVVRLDRGTMQPTTPDMAASLDGEFVAITWSDGYIPTAAGQGYVYLSYGSETDGGWPRIRAYPPAASTTSLAKQSAIAFDPRAAASRRVHLAWSQHTGAGQVFNQIYYATCDLANIATCYSLSPTTVRSVSRNVFMPDIAVDKAGTPHVVWVEEGAGGTETAIKYASGSNWGSVLNISPSSGVTVTQPSIAYADVGASGCLHIVWASNSNTASATFESIGYARRDLGGSCGGNLGPLYFNQWSLADHSNPKNPRVAASGNTVYVVWDIDSGGTVDGYDNYYLVYNYSTDGGTTWARPDGTPPEYLDFPSGGVASFTPHPSQDELESGRRQYASRLRPDVTLEGTTPHLVWSQVVTRPGENEYHFDVLHTTYQGSTWLAATNVTTGTKAEFDIHSAAPAVVVGKDGHVHAAYLEETKTGPGSWLWDQVVYQGPIEDRTPDIFLPVIFRNGGV
jgi:hypothetical protein